MRIDETRIHNVYEERVENRNEGNRVSFNGGEGGLRTRPTPEEERAGSERHVAATEEQHHHAETARTNPEMRSKANHGDPPVKATARAGDFSAHGEAGARAESPAGAEHAGAEAHTYNHASDLQMNRPDRPNSGDARADKNYQKQQDKLYAQQQKERDRLQAQQEKEHQKKLNDTQHQQMEQRHAQQTQQLQQRHEQQRQAIQSHAPAPHTTAPRPR